MKGLSTRIGAIILGIVAGFLGRFLMPGPDPMGFLATTILGLIGAVVGVMIVLAIYRAVAKPGDKHHGRAARA